MPFFELQHQDKSTHARAGVMHTDHGDIETPVFMPVGTQASVKTLDQNDLANLSAPIILGNTYHLHLRPGEDLINSFGGLHKFMNWPKPILTDSGGFQVFSLGLQKDNKHQSVILSETKDPSRSGERDSSALPQNDNQAKLVSIDEDGVTFRSHIDGSSHRFTAESAIDIQHKLGADIIMAFDECTPDGIDEKYVREAMERTHRWAERSLKRHKELQAASIILNEVKNPLHSNREGSFAVAQDDKRKNYRQFLFGIIQGSNYKHLREESAKYISDLDFDGIAIGGESVGYNMEATKEILNWVYPIIPENKPHYTMGVGLSPADLLVAIEHGADMFDCVAPTRLARHGMLFCHCEEGTDEAIPSTGNTNNGIAAHPSGARNDKRHRINITNAKFTNDSGPIDKNCTCSTCQNYSRAYIHHLFNTQELSAMRLATIHNLHFMLNLMRQAREAILEDRFLELKKEWC